MTSSRIAQQEIEPLPRSARIALARRCLGRVRPVLATSPIQLRVLDSVLDRLTTAATTGQGGDDVADAAASAYTLALDNVDGKTAEADEDVLVITLLAHAAAFAAEAATVNDAKQAAHLVAQSVDFAIHAARLSGRADVGATLAGMRSDLETLRQASVGWSDETCVSAALLAP